LKVKLKDFFGRSVPEFHTPVIELHVWGIEESLMAVTMDPGATVSEFGLKK
jgi:hypothetical protein